MRVGEVQQTHLGNERGEFERGELNGSKAGGRRASCFSRSTKLSCGFSLIYRLRLPLESAVSFLCRHGAPALRISTRPVRRTSSASPRSQRRYQVQVE